VVLTTSYTQENLKRILERANSSFRTVAAKTPGATYRVLWYQSSPSSYYSRKCKVDLLQPGIMNIPSVPTEAIIHRSGLPLMPFLPLLLLKLQAWEDHGASLKYYMREKQPTDVRDIDELLRIAVRDTTIKIDKVAAWISDVFISEGQRRVTKYAGLYPASASSWARIGFETKKIGIKKVVSAPTAYRPTGLASSSRYYRGSSGSESNYNTQ
jgi:hypothetical protein